MRFLKGLGITLLVIVCICALTAFTTYIIALAKDVAFVDLWKGWFETIKETFVKPEVQEEVSSAVSVIASKIRG